MLSNGETVTNTYHQMLRRWGELTRKDYITEEDEQEIMDLQDAMDYILENQNT